MVAQEQKNICLYYTARLERSKCWLVSSLIRGSEHIAFDRCLDPVESIFEFFVPEGMEQVFLQVIDYLQKQGAVLELEKKENRFLTDPSLS